VAKQSELRSSSGFESVVLSYSYVGLTSFEFSRERTLKRVVVISSATSQINLAFVMLGTQGLVEQSFDLFQFRLKKKCVVYSTKQNTILQ